MALTLAGSTVTQFATKVLNFEREESTLGELGKKLVLFKDVKNLSHMLNVFFLSS
jgi:hypothetical protein